MQNLRNPMIDALRKQKGQGVDITIVLGGDDENQDDEQKELGLAPEGTDVGKDQDETELEDAQMAPEKQLIPGAENLETENDGPINPFHQAMQQGAERGAGPLARAAMLAHKGKGILK